MQQIGQAGSRLPSLACAALPCRPPAPPVLLSRDCSSMQRIATTFVTWIPCDCSSMQRIATTSVTWIPWPRPLPSSSHGHKPL
eukprot:365110-Chlamydomonas_euryale.AAC.3